VVFAVDCKIFFGSDERKWWARRVSRDSARRDDAWSVVAAPAVF
jgi:hypothetical protein